MPTTAPQPNLDRWSERLRRQLGQLGGRYQRWAEQNPEALARLRLWGLDLAQAPAQEGLLGLLRTFMHSVGPPNWQTLRPGASMLEADRLINETGLCLVWVPEAEVIAELLAADGKDERDAVLVRNSERILISIESVLAEVNYPELGILRGLGGEALAAARGGHFGAAQTLASTILSSVLEKHYGLSFGLARTTFDAEPPLSSGLWSHRRTLVQRALQLAFLKSDRRSADAGFNRHLTSHGADLAHLSQPHALEALLLLGGTLRELQEIYRVAECGFAPTERLEANAARARPMPLFAPAPRPLSVPHAGP